jgi:DNA-binding NarL/FixJ family response regulator
MNTLKILIADDHELIREGLKVRLEKQPGWKVCGEAANGRQAVEMARELQPQIVVLDISMPELNGIEAARQIRKACPQTEVLILTMQESEGLVREVLEAGARGFILKTDTTRLLIAAIETLAQHQPFFTGQVSELVLGRFLDKDVAATLGVSVKTIDAHRANIMRKLNLHSVAELVRYAIRNQLIEP